ncbi:C39 family peptidase [Patescibacteria group bacterium]|nr:C39 family peptidase [Patescibacteria group bacterium]
MSKSRLRLIKIVGICVILVIAVFALYKGRQYLSAYTHNLEQKNTISQISDNDVVKRETDITPTDQLVNKNFDQHGELLYESTGDLPLKAYLKVPFVTQAPFENEESWKIHDESCEEAAIYQVVAYQNGVSEIDRAEADRVFREMIAWQRVNFGEHRDIYDEDVKKLITGYYKNISGERVRVILNAELDDIKKFIAAGIPVIAPATAKILRNPYYHHATYHMVTVIGYTEDRLITNDVGTKRGKDFSYDNQVFMQAMKDATGFIVVILPE